MRTTDLFTNNRSPKKLNETIEKTFGIKLNLESFTIEQLEDARNKLRTQIYTARSESSFNETVENDTLTQAQWMHDAIVAELMVRDEPIVDNTMEAEGAEQMTPNLSKYVLDQVYNSNGDVTMTDLFDEGIPGLRDMFMATAEELGLDPDEDFMDVESAVLEKLEDLVSGGQDVAEGADFDKDEVSKILSRFESDLNEIGGYADLNYDKIMSILAEEGAEAAVEEVSYSIGDKDGGEVRGVEPYLEDLVDNLDYVVNGSGDEPDDNTDDSYALASAGHGSDEDYGGDFDQNESAPPTAKGERMVKHIKQGYAKDGKLTDKEKSIAYATAWKQHNKNESVNTGEDMTRLQEGEIQQASAIVTAKTMVDRVGRWIEELSGMENDTLLQLGDSIRDEMSQDLAKNFISTVAPAIQQALQNLKDTRETLATGVRTLTGEEQPAEMLGAEPGMGADAGAEMGPAEPDAMNAEAPIDDFAAAEPAIGGDEAAGRAQRESINRSSNLLRVLAG